MGTGPEQKTLGLVLRLRLRLRHGYGHRLGHSHENNNPSNKPSNFPPIHKQISKAFPEGIIKPNIIHTNLSIHSGNTKEKKISQIAKKHIYKTTKS